MSPGPAGAPLDVLVIGGGQAGLAMGYHLAQRGLSFQIVDAGAEIGHVWRSRWDSLRLFTSGRYDNLPGLPFPAAPDNCDLLLAHDSRAQTSPPDAAHAGDGKSLMPSPRPPSPGPATPGWRARTGACRAWNAGPLQ